MAAPSALVSAVPLYPAEKAASAAKVCVTGATGFIAGPVIERLLRAGHTVHATCRQVPEKRHRCHRLSLHPVQYIGNMGMLFEWQDAHSAPAPSASKFVVRPVRPAPSPPRIPKPLLCTRGTRQTPRGSEAQVLPCCLTHGVLQPPCACAGTLRTPRTYPA